MATLDITGVDPKVQGYLAAVGTGEYRSAGRVYLTEDGKATDKAEDAAFLLCAEGGRLPQSVADELGLGASSPAPAPAPTVKGGVKFPAVGLESTAATDSNPPI